MFPRAFVNKSAIGIFLNIALYRVFLLPVDFPEVTISKLGPAEFGNRAVIT
jgi:hypothetical protein